MWVNILPAFIKVSKVVSAIQMLLITMCRKHKLWPHYRRSCCGGISGIPMLIWIKRVSKMWIGYNYVSHYIYLSSFFHKHSTKQTLWLDTLWYLRWNTVHLYLEETEDLVRSLKAEANSKPDCNRLMMKDSFGFRWSRFSSRVSSLCKCIISAIKDWPVESCIDWWRTRSPRRAGTCRE